MSGRERLTNESVVRKSNDQFTTRSTRYKWSKCIQTFLPSFAPRKGAGSWGEQKLEEAQAVQGGQVKERRPHCSKSYYDSWRQISHTRVSLLPILPVPEDSAHALGVYIPLPRWVHTNISAEEVGGFNSQFSESETAASPSDSIG